MKAWRRALVQLNFRSGLTSPLGENVHYFQRLINSLEYISKLQCWINESLSGKIFEKIWFRCSVIMWSYTCQNSDSCFLKSHERNWILQYMIKLYNLYISIRYTYDTIYVWHTLRSISAMKMMEVTEIIFDIKYCLLFVH